MKRYICIHGHFYQPPRENPWLEEIELQESAYPYHDWNERINAECYESNAVSRILDEDGRIRSIVNNYAGISFNFGPTVLAWMEAHAPETYRRILDADRISRERFNGHGSAMAQAYNHMIMPLANRRDKVTQVKWGIADFRRRFGRDPEGMWLPETAVDLETLEVLAEHGIRFTVFAPNQAARTRIIGAKPWREIKNDDVDPTQSYAINLPSGRSIAAFFYDGPVSQAIAFDRLLSSGEHFAQRLLGLFPQHAEHPVLVNIATDGETYGHHHRHGDMALAFALSTLDDEPSIELTNYAEFLERHPPTHEAQVHEQSSWSCVHGVGRWWTNCGCHTGRGQGWTQEWRTPLRNSLDWLRDALIEPFESAGRDLFRDPWAARDDYIEVILDRSRKRVGEFLRQHGSREFGEHDAIRALKLMELQRNLMLMYTSCGWFFDELTGIETVQVIQYAGRAVQLAEELFGDHLESQFLDRLAEAQSNLPEHGNGRDIYLRWVKPAMVDLPTVVGHYAISSLFTNDNGADERDRIFCYDLDRIDAQSMEMGRLRHMVGQTRITSRITLESGHYTYAALHLGDQNLLGSVRSFRSDEEYARLLTEVRSAFSVGDVPETIRCLDRHFGDHRYTVMSLFRDDQRRVLDRLLTATLEEVGQSYRRVYEDNFALMQSLSGLGAPLPAILKTTAEFVLNLDIRRAFEADEPDLDRIRELFATAATCRLELDAAGLAYALQKAMERVADQFTQLPDDMDVLDRLDRLAEAAQVLPFEVDLWKVQNIYFALREQVMAPAPVTAGAPDADHAARDEQWMERFRTLGDRLRIAPPEE